MTLLATNRNATVTEPDLPGNDPTPSPLPSADEVTSFLFPSDAGGVGYLFDHDLLDAVPTPLEDVPHNAPDAGALAMSAVNEGAAADNAHVSSMPDIPSPVTGGELGLTTAEPVDTPAPLSPLRATLLQEGQRLRQLFVNLGGQVGGNG